jgi:hypothetical protein
MGKESVKAAKRGNKKRNIILGIVLLLIVLLLFAKWLLIDEGAYYLQWWRCGQRPLITTSYYGTLSYIKYGDKDYYQHSSGLIYYICTEQEAQNQKYQNQSDLRQKRKQAGESFY